jgi:RNA polymerase sigma-70 factor (ECF subfamily)
LLEKLKFAPPNSPEWVRLHELYSPLVRRWLQRIPGLGDDAADLVQEVLMVIVRELPAFERQRDGSFRCWLRLVTINRARKCWKQRQRRPAVGRGEDTENFLTRLEDPASLISKQWDEEHDRYVLDRLLMIVEKDFAPRTWQAFRQFALDGSSAAHVAAELGMTENSVLLAKSRVLKRLREETAGLVD